MKTEQDYLEELSPFQLDIVETLKNMGYIHNYFHTYIEKETMISIDVSRLKTLKDVIVIFYNEGSDQKRFEIKKALGI
uniref:hypothetical protein n=1 Tax=uncultured Dysgonomonas sp. TaxID=206096 RepID=UPI00261E74FF|nr:hypothetical protein [uncultured Dysgonomonas sp.]